MDSIRNSFVDHFGEEQARAIERAAISHENGIHDRRGSDPFRWAICICLGYKCMENEAYRQEHEVTIPWSDLDSWIIEHGNLTEHDGDVDYLALFCGVYEKYVSQELAEV